MTEAATGFEIAVIGMSCHVPGANTVEQFWDNLREGRESISQFSEAELVASGVPPELRHRPDYVRAAGVLDEVARFDAGFFGYPPREAQLIDPQQRMFLERAWEALERAGHDPARERASIGVFAGMSASSYLFTLLTHPDLWQQASANQTVLDKDFLATRVAYKLDLRGPAVGIQTACSSSLAAVHLACQSLLAGECDIALAGGVSVAVPQNVGYRYEVDGIRSRDGHCRTFDAAASGAVRGSGLGIVVLRRLQEAVADGDHVGAVIKGSAMNNDGARKVGFTAPRVESQAQVIKAALAIAGVEPDSVGYVEAHGTATALGDPIEVRALAEAFRGRDAGRAACGIGSVKTNIGHLDAAAGVVGLIKTVLMLRERERVPSLHFERPNPRLELETTPFFVCTRREHWESAGAPRRAGVSSFGMGGTNVHVVLEEAAAPADLPVAPGPHVFLLSARTESALVRMQQRLADDLARHPERDAADVAYTLRVGRRAFAHRCALVGQDLSDATRQLAQAHPPGMVRDVAEERAGGVAFLFPGQGAQRVGMARDLYGWSSVFRSELDDCCRVLEPRLGLDLRHLLFPAGADAEDAGERLAETRIAQPALFVVEYALARLWQFWGVEPEALIGHSVGEYVAACLAGVMERDVALGIVAERGRVMQACAPGAMLAVALPRDRVAPLLATGVSLAAHNAPDACVVAGGFAEIERCEALLGEQGVPCARLATSHAFHSPSMEGALEPFATHLAGLDLRPPRIPMLSNLTGDWLTPAQATSVAYWTRQLREPVLFAEGLARLLEDPRRRLLEVGPGQALTAFARRLGARGTRAQGSLPRTSGQADEVAGLLRAAAGLWAAGIAIDWSAGERPRRRVSLPTYPFEGERYWVEPRRLDDAGGGAEGDEARREPLERWFYVPSWTRGPAPAGGTPAEACFGVLDGGSGLGPSVARRLEGLGARVALARAGGEFAREGAGRYVVGGGAGAHDRLLDALEEDGIAPQQFVHLGGTHGDGPDALEHGLHDLLALAQTVGRRAAFGTTLTVVTRAALDVTGEGSPIPARAAVLGASRVIAQEYPHLHCRSVDLSAPGDGDPDHDTLDLVAELATAPAEPVVAYRGRYRWLQRFERVGLSAPGEAVAVRPRGVYLITGGFGDVGLALARRLAREAQARLVLVGRSVLTAPGTGGRRREAVAELESLGAEVLPLSADVADPEAMRRVLAEVHERFGAVNGVVHAAGIRDAVRPLPGLDRAEVERQLRPKVRGTQVLADLTADEPLDFVLLTSSLASILGGLGFAAYAAANAYLDAFAAARRGGRCRWVSVNWDGWRSSSVSDPARARMALGEDEGGEAFVRILARPDLAQVAVSTTDLGERQSRWVRSLLRGHDATPAAEPVLHARPPLHTVYVAPEHAMERRLAALWGGLLGIDRVGVDDSFFELGGDSLLAVQMVARLREELRAELSVATLFEAPTVRSLSALLQARHGNRETARHGNGTEVGVASDRAGTGGSP
jgi:acyl transferase domain-containing protein